MKYNFSFYLLTVFLLFSTLVEAQWIKQSNGLPDDWSVGISIDACDSNNSIISTRSTGLFKTTDGGNLWFQVQLPDTLIEEVVDLSMPDPLLIWAATDLGKIIASTNGGQSWDIQFDDTSKTEFMNYIEMFDISNGVAMGDAPFPNQNNPALFLKTTDGGTNWEILSNLTFINVWSGDTWRRLDFVDPMQGYFYESGINPQKLYKTTDGCINWTATNFADYATVLKCFDENIVLTQSTICNPVCVSTINKTTDGGENWSETQLGNKWGNDFEFIPGNASKAFFTDFDKLYFSNDTGSTWTEIIVDTIDLDGRDIIFTDENNGWILGDNGNVYKTNVGGVIVDVNEPMLDLPTEFSLSQNYPNPFNPSTTISWQSPVSSHQTLKVYDVLGNEVSTLVDEFRNAGSYDVDFNASKLSSGVYFYRLQAGSFIQTKKMILIK